MQNSRNESYGNNSYSHEKQTSRFFEFLHLLSYQVFAYLKVFGKAGYAEEFPVPAVYEFSVGTYVVPVKHLAAFYAAFIIHKPLCSGALYIHGAL